MPTITLNNNATMHYEDSGAVPGVAYTTLIWVHGMGFNSGVFKKLFGPAAAHKFRIVAINRRDYHPTTGFTPDEGKLLAEGGESHRQHLRNMGLELADFIDKFIQQNDLPLPTESGEGGVVPTGWSLGGTNIHAFLSCLDQVGAATLERFNKYIRTVLIYDISSSAVGVVNPSQYNIDIWFNPDVPTRFKNFRDWAVAYYKHKNIHSGNPDDLTYNCAWEFTPEKAAELNIPVHEKAPSLSELSEEEMKQVTSVEAFGGSDTAILFISRDLARDEIRRSLFDKDLATRLPNLKVRYLGAAETPGILLFALWDIKKGLDDPSYFGGEKARDVKILYTDHGNHFIFWDEPEFALQQYRRCLVE